MLRNHDVACVVVAPPAVQASLQARQEEVIREISLHSVRNDSRFRQRAIEIQHADQTWPLSTPVRNCKDRSLMSRETGKHVMTVLPDSFDNDQRRFCGMSRKTSMPRFCESMKPCCLAGSKACALCGVNPSSRIALKTAASTRCWAGQQTRLAESRRSPLAIADTVLDIAIHCYRAEHRGELRSLWLRLGSVVRGSDRSRLSRPSQAKLSDYAAIPNACR